MMGHLIKPIDTFAKMELPNITSMCCLMRCLYVVYVLSMCCLYIVYVLSMCCLCVDYVLSMCCLCVFYVLYMCFLISLDIKALQFSILIVIQIHKGIFFWRKNASFFLEIKTNAKNVLKQKNMHFFVTFCAKVSFKK